MLIEFIWGYNQAGSGFTDLTPAGRIKIDRVDSITWCEADSTAMPTLSRRIALRLMDEGAGLHVERAYGGRLRPSRVAV